MNKLRIDWRERFAQIELKVAIRTGVTAAISYVLAFLLRPLIHDPNSVVGGTWTVLSAIVVVQAQIGGTYKAAWMRFSGVLAGSILGGFFTYFFGSSPIPLAFAVTVTVILCTFLNLKESVRIACLSTAVVMVLWGINPTISPWKFAAYRFFDSCLGILVALATTHLLWPSQVTQKMREQLAEAMGILRNLLKVVFSDREEESDKQWKSSVKDIEAIVQQNMDSLKEAKIELLTRPESLEEWILVQEKFQRMFESFITLHAIAVFHPRRMCDALLIDKLSVVLQRMEEVFGDLIQTLRMEESGQALNGLLEAHAVLEEDLNRFRSTRATRQFNFQEVESFFVLFYALRELVRDLSEMTTELNSLNKLE